MSNSKNKSWLKIAFGILLVIALIAVGVSIYQSRNSTKQDASIEQASAQSQQVKFALAKDESSQQDELSSDTVNRERLRQHFLSSSAAVDTTQLEAEVQTVISQNPDIVFGVSIKDLGTGTVYDYGNKGAMTAASVMKVLTATYYLHQVELGNRSLSTVMPNGKTAQYNMEQMIVVSDNNAWETLNNNLGYSQMQSYAHSIGLTSYNYTNNTISSSHTAKLLGDLYERKLINESNTQLLLSYMERANYRDLIIPAVPSTDTVYHKAGEYLSSLNDAAIITNGTDSIVLSIYTHSTSSYSKSRVAALMQQITTPTITAFHLN